MLAKIRIEHSMTQQCKDLDIAMEVGVMLMPFIKSLIIMLCRT